MAVQESYANITRRCILANHCRQLLLLILIAFLGSMVVSAGAEELNTSTWEVIKKVNKEGPYLGIIVPNAFELGPLLQSPSYVVDPKLPYLDFAGRRFRFATIGKKEKVIVVMTGLAMLNAGVTTQLLLTLFNIKGVIHFGIAGNADPSLQIGDVTIPQYWAHTGLWNWQRFGNGPNDTLAFESSGDYTRQIGSLNFSQYDVIDGHNNPASSSLLNSVWYQPEEIFPVNGVPEVRQHAFWVPVDSHYYNLSKNVAEHVNLEQCINATLCLPKKPVVARVANGCSASVFVDNAAYRQFLRTKFNVTAIDMETAAVALVSLEQQKPFIAIRALSDLAGGGSALSNEAGIFAGLAAQNAVDVAVQFILSI